jgi:hypothetical protein
VELHPDVPPSLDPLPPGINVLVVVYIKECEQRIGVTH